MMRRILTFLLFACVLVLVAALMLAWGGYQAARREPEFYRKALQAPPAQQEQMGDQMERAALDLHNNVRHDGRWQATFTADQVNGWLAADLPQKFPRLLPPEMREPRVAIAQNEAHVACRYDNGQLDTVISFSLQANLTDQPNTIALRISKLRAGALPVPLRQFLDPITTAAQQGQIPLRWSQSEGDPVALLTIPFASEQFGNREIHLDAIELKEGELRVAGSSTAE
jgi:hypothetical protein